MAKVGMQMPGGRQRQKASPDIYTGLLFLAVIVLGAATGVVFMQASKVAPPGGNPLAVQDTNRVQLGD